MHLCANDIFECVTEVDHAGHAGNILAGNINSDAGGLLDIAFVRAADGVQRFIDEHAQAAAQSCAFWLEIASVNAIAAGVTKLLPFSRAIPQAF